MFLRCIYKYLVFKWSLWNQLFAIPTNIHKTMSYEVTILHFYTQPSLYTDQWNITKGHIITLIYQWNKKAIKQYICTGNVVLQNKHHSLRSRKFWNGFQVTLYQIIISISKNKNLQPCRHNLTFLLMLEMCTIHTWTPMNNCMFTKRSASFVLEYLYSLAVIYCNVKKFLWYLYYLTL